MAECFEQTQNWKGDLLESPYIKHIIRLSCCRTIVSEKCHDALFGMIDDFDNIGSIKESIFYLENADWNASEAFVQKELDNENRKGPALDTHGNPIDNCAANPRIDRSVAKPGNKFNVNLCQIDIMTEGGERTFSYPHADTLNPNNQADINSLNRWRHRIFREHVGPANTTNTHGIEYHSLQIDYILNRYAEQQIDPRGRASYASIAKDHNAVFEGVLLPGRVTACEPRTTDSLTSLLTRKAVNPKGPRGWPKAYNGVMRHKAAQKRVRKEWRQRVKENDERAAAKAETEETEAQEEEDGSDSSDWEE